MAAKSKYERTIELAWEFLPTRASGNRMKSTDLMAAIEASGKSLDMPTSTFTQYLTRASSEADATGITRNPGVQGYFTEGPDWSAPADDADTDDSDEVDDLGGVEDSAGEDAPAKRRYRQIERLLYPHLVDYLMGHGYQAMDVSTSLRLGQWGCPDVLGVRSDRVFNGREHETVSIEAKQTDKDFEKDIFEAVAHRRFVNRAYFAFAANSSYLTRRHDKLRYYAELYKVGVLVVVIADDSHLPQFLNGELSEIPSDDVTVVELVSAPFEEKRPRWQADLFEQLGWRDDSDIAGWGSSTPD